uniref:Wsv440-like protein n=1 Tax=Chionoecetes opilio bacilliform virus TaxID=1825681 RepID=A0A1Q3DL29_9VIRU|nr:wsv440-like protein [Chionoecetes opilio bacilliform virus]GAV93210.1 hypothetical protein SCV_090 [Chionoecetes opilio bacilliform virus]
MPIGLKEAEKLVRWYNKLDCGCPISKRVSCVLGALGGGIDAAAIRSRPDLTTSHGDDFIVPSRVTRLIEGILLERALSKPDLAAAAFDLTGILTYCTCNSFESNFNLSTMTAWIPVDTNKRKIRVTCPSCTFDYGNNTELNGCVRAEPLISLLRKRADEETCPERAETKHLFSLLIGAAGGCGRLGAQQANFNGSWTSLSFNRSSPMLLIEADVLVSNRVSPSVRLQPMCICSEFLYAVTSSLSHEAAYKARNMTVIEGGEFLFFRYTIFEEGGVFDSTVDVSSIISGEPTSETGCMAAAAAAASLVPTPSTSEDYIVTSPTSKRRKKDNTPIFTSSMSTTNEVDMQSLLMTVLSCGKTTAPARTRKKKKPPVVSNDGMVDDQCKTNYIIPCPQIDEQSIVTYQRQSHISYLSKVTKHPVVINESMTVNVDVRLFRKNFTLPPSHILFSPPLIIRKGLNRFKIISDVLKFFDSVEINEEWGSSPLGNNAAHAATLNLLSCIRKNSLTRSVSTAPSKGFNVICKTPTTNIGVSISSKEIQTRQLCTATTLHMLAGLAK